MELSFTVNDVETCRIKVWDDKVPGLAATLREQLPMKSTLQHGKLIGDMVFFSLPIVAPWENMYLTEEVGAMRRAETGEATGAVCFYSPRQQFCIVYGDDTADENLQISYIGEIISGHLEMRLLGLETWIKQGAIVELAVA
jgi:hypothetical protein